jgi:hypothetical protein
MNALLRPAIHFTVRTLLICLFATQLTLISRAQTNATPDDPAKIKSLNDELEQAIQKVREIVNQPVTRHARQPGMRIANSQAGWFHEGATKPAFPVVDVRTTQEFPYDKYPYVTSDLNPGVVFVGSELEFNSNTKYFYTDRTVPKKKLSEAEMLEINRLYRIIGRCEHDLHQLKMQPLQATEPEESQESSPVEPHEDDPRQAKPILPGYPRISRLTGGIAIGAVLVLYIGYRIFRR